MEQTRHKADTNHRLFDEQYEQIVSGLWPNWFVFCRNSLCSGRFVPGPVPKTGGAGGQNPLHLYPESGQKLHANMQPRAKKNRGNFPAFFVRFFGQEA